MTRRITRQGLMVRMLEGEAPSLYVAYSTGAQAFADGGRFQDPVLDDLRAAWSAPFAGYTYTAPPAPLGDVDRVLAFFGDGRVYLSPTTVTGAQRVIPGDGIGSGVTRGYHHAAVGGPLQLGLRWLFADGSHLDQVLDTIAAGTANMAWHYPTSNDELTVPAGATHAVLWLDGSTGWAVAPVDSGQVYLNSVSQVGPDFTGAMTIRRGRAGVDEAPTPATLTTTLALTGAVPLTRGDPVQVVVELPADLWAGGDPGNAGQRFVGNASDVPIRLTRSRLHTLDAIATSPLARLARTVVGDTPWPQETSGQRAQRILDAAQNADELLLVGDVDPGGPQVLPRDVDAQPVLGLLAELVASAGGQLLEDRDGTLRWRGPDTTYGAPAVTLSAGHYATPLNLVQDVAINAVRVLYGPTDANPRSHVEVEDLSSISVRGRELLPLDTVLATEAGALDVARRKLGEGTATTYQLRRVTVDVLDLMRRWRELGDDGARAAAADLLRMDQGALLELEDLPPETPALAGGGLFVVHGIAETLTAHSWRMELDLLDLALLAEPLAYEDVPDAVRIADVPPDLTISAATTWRP